MKVSEIKIMDKLRESTPELEDLNNNDMVSISGGSEFSDWTWRMIGKAVGHIANAFDAYVNMYDNAHKNGYRGPH